MHYKKPKKHDAISVQLFWVLCVCGLIVWFFLALALKLYIRSRACDCSLHACINIVMKYCQMVMLRIKY